MKQAMYICSVSSWNKRLETLNGITFMQLLIDIFNLLRLTISLVFFQNYFWNVANVTIYII